MANLYEIPNATGGVDAILVNTANVVPSFFPMMLLFVFMVVLIGGSTAQRRRTGFADFPMWSVIASVSTLMITLPLTLVVGIIQIEVLAVVVAVTLMSGLWFFMSKSRGEF
jgi:hypothetical protein